MKLFRIFYNNSPKQLVQILLGKIFKESSIDAELYAKTIRLNSSNSMFLNWDRYINSYNNKKNIELFENHLIQNIESKLEGLVEGSSHRKSEMTPQERRFLNGIIRLFKPSIIVEMGVSTGGSSCVILNAIEDNPNSCLYSFDYNDDWYRNDTFEAKKTGFLVSEIVPHLTGKWKLFTGGNPSRHLRRLKLESVDLCFIDTVHSNPGEFINVLEILPFMSKNGIIVFHDTALHSYGNETLYTNCVALNSLEGELFEPNLSPFDGIPNIGAKRLSGISEQSVYSMFKNLSLPWTYKITQEDFEELLQFLDSKYPKEYVKIFEYYANFISCECHEKILTEKLKVLLDINKIISSAGYYWRRFQFVTGLL